MPKKRKPTMIDVAREAGVSTATVSRALNGGRVIAGTRRRVEEAITRLGYRHNALARGLVTGRTGVIAVVIPEILGPLYAQMARGIEDVLEPHGMHAVVVTDNRDPDRERATIELLLRRQIDALIIIGSHLEPEELHSLTEDTPLVLVQPETPASQHLGVELDNASGIEAAVALLNSQGHHRIAHLAGIRRDGRERHEAFRGTMRAHGLDANLVFAGDFSEVSGMRAGDWLRSQDATAIVCASDAMALGLYHSLRESGVRIPEQMSIIGFDDQPWCAYQAPPLTTVRQPARTMGQIAASQALDADGRTGPQRIEPTLVDRASVAPVTHAPRR